MLQWWADYLDANREKAVSPFDYSKDKTIAIICYKFLQSKVSLIGM